MDIIVAVDSDGGFGKDGKIPWHFKCDFAHFKKVTEGKVCVMGKNTYLDMAEMIKSRGKEIGDAILPNRQCYVVTSTLTETPGATPVSDIQDVINLHGTDIMVLGGERLYIRALSSAEKVHMTVIDKHYDCDVHFPVEAMEKYFEISEGTRETENGTELLFVTYVRK